MTRPLAVLSIACAVALCAAGFAGASVARDATLARRGIAHAVARHWVKQGDAAQYRGAVARTLRDVRVLPALRARILESQLAQLTPLWDSYTSPRALALFSQLAENASYLETHRVPAARLDVAGPDGVVYRWFPSLGLEFHPLASFGALNAVATAGDLEATRTLAAALVSRAIPHGNRLLWEYAFPFSGGAPPWASGMAQAVAAQALVRAGTVLQDRRLLQDAAAAYASVPPFVLTLPSGPWIRLYGFDGEVVLNAQLQTILSLAEYAAATGDASAAQLATRLGSTAQALFARFDTGDWSLYELGGAYAPPDYEVFVTELLAKLAASTQDPFWIEAAQRFHDYLYTAPQVTQTAATPTLYPQPQDGYLDTAAIPVTLAQRAAVTLSVAGVVRTWRFGPGAHTLTWTPSPALPPGTYPVSVSAVSHAGLRSTQALAPIVVAWDTAPPALGTPALANGVLTWQATDPGTPWLALQVTFADPTAVQPPQTVDLGQQPLGGTAPVAVPAGSWDATLSATNSAGLTATFDLGPVTG
ncbi:MAG: D-glucuronyl C5-epimerase family protein [Gaiellaceae bacterium]